MKFTAKCEIVPKFVRTALKLIIKISILVFVNAYCCAETDAQHTRWFLKTDLGLSTMRFHPEKSVSPGFGYGIGLERELSLKSIERFSIHPSLLFVRSAYLQHPENRPKEKASINYFRMDLPFVLRVYDGNPGHNLFVGAGPFLAFPFSGHYTDSFERKQMIFGNAPSSNLRSIDAGLVSRLMMNHFLNTNVLLLIQYNQGFLNLNPQFSSDNIKMRSRNFYLSFLFPLERRKRR